MGKSSVGKDTVYKRLQKELKLNTVVLYTTRPKRDGEEDGREYYFVTEEKMRDLKTKGKVIELREYQTVHGAWYYFTVDDGQLNLSKGNYLLIGTLESYQKMREYYGKEYFIPLYLEAEDGIRLERALQREKQQNVPRYAELCRRFLADEKDFSEENLKACGIKRRYQNIDLEICLMELKKEISGGYHYLIEKLWDVEITDTYRENALEKEMAYLKSLDVDRLLAGFYEIKGLKPKKVRYGGWESLDIKGHTMGHYLTALAQAYTQTKEKWILERLIYIMAELQKCQLENGYLSAFPEEQFNRLERGEKAWVPWYTLHKILSGVTVVYEKLGKKIENAKYVMEQLATWVSGRANKWDSKLKKQVLATEYGGMNDVMFEIYRITQKEEYLKAACQFEELDLFTEIKEGHDILNNKHANTTIPKFLGAVNHYMATGEPFYLEAAESFFQIVEKHHTYITGGNSEWEHFGLPGILDKERTNCNCETCNTHNMLKLAERLYQITGKKQYMDYYENTIINAILASQNPETGMSMYFQPMATGYFKVFSRPYEDFWCCTGTGMENFTKLQEGIYYKDREEENKIYINQYISSKLVFSNKKGADFILIQQTDIPVSDKVYFQVCTRQNKKGTKVTLCFRLPFWLSGKARLWKEKTELETRVENGYLVWEGEVENGIKLLLQLPIEVCFQPLPDNKNAVAFRYGPIVLSASHGTDSLKTEPVGVDVMTPVKIEGIQDQIKIYGKVEEWLEGLPLHFRRQGEGLEFHLSGTDRDQDLVFQPYYNQYQGRYGIYYNLIESV